MSKAVEAETEKRIRRIAGELEPLLALPGIKVTHQFKPGFDEDDHFIIADSKTFWQYRTATITWNLGKCASSDDAELLEDMIHEYVHVLIAPMESIVRKDSTADQCELAVENIARALHCAITS